MTTDNGLTPEQVRLLTQSQAHKGIRYTGTRHIQPRADCAQAVLSSAQQRLRFNEKLSFGTAQHHIPDAYRVSGLLNLIALQASLNEVIQRHVISRTSFVQHDDEPVQRRTSAMTAEMPVHDLSGLSGDTLRKAVDHPIQEEVHRIFSLEKGPLIRTALLDCPGREFAILLTLHHILTDVWSTGILITELATLDRVFAAGRQPKLHELSVQCTHFAEWGQGQLHRSQFELGLQYGRRRVGGAPPIPQLPFDRPAPAKRSHVGPNVWPELPAFMLSQLQKLGGFNKATLFMVGLVACNALLRKHTGQTDIATGMPVVSCHQDELEPLIGFSVNRLALRAGVGRDPVFTESVECGAMCSTCRTPAFMTIYSNWGAILAISIIALLIRAFQIEVSPARFFRRPSVRGVVTALAQLGDGKDALDDIQMLYQLIASLPAAR